MASGSPKPALWTADDVDRVCASLGLMLEGWQRSWLIKLGKAPDVRVLADYRGNMVYARQNQKRTMYDMLNALQQDRRTRSEH